jgi:hypothetical protein
MKCNIEYNSIPSSYKKLHFIHTCCSTKLKKFISTQVLLDTNGTSNVHFQQKILGLFLQKLSLLCFQKDIIFVTNDIQSFCLFNLRTLHGNEVAPHILHQLQFLLCWHFDISSLLLTSIGNLVHWKLGFRLFHLGIVKFYAQSPSSCILISSLYKNNHPTWMKIIVICFLKTLASNGRYNICALIYTFEHTSFSHQ